MENKEQKQSANIDEIETSLESAVVTSPPPIHGQDDWGAESRKEDEYSDRDGESRVKIYTMSIPNEQIVNGAPNPAFRKLTLDRTGKIAPRELIRFTILDRVISNIASIPYKQQQAIPKDEPWKKYLGYSKDGKVPTSNEDGIYFPLCLSDKEKKVAYTNCSFPTRYEDGEVVIEPLKQGECPWAKWGSSMTSADRQKYAIAEDATPKCNLHIILYCWDLDLNVPFISYHKVTSLQTAKDALASCTRGFGENKTKYPFHAFEFQMTVQQESTYVIPKITNTGKFNDKVKIKPIYDWFQQNHDKFVRNLAIQMNEMKKKKEKESETKPSA